MSNQMVSIIVATYRREESLIKALDSLAIQTFKDIEIILVDDNDNEEWNRKVSKIVESFKNINPFILLTVIQNHPNQGSAKSRNIGIEAAQGKYITFLDDDDVYLMSKVKKQVEFMECGGYDYSVTDLVLYNEEGKEIDKRVRFYIKDTTINSLKVYHLKYHITGTDTMMFRKDYLTKIGGFTPIDVGDEFYLMQKAIDNRGKFGYLPGCEIKAYVHTGENGLSSGEKKIQGEKALYEYKKNFFDGINLKTKRYIRMRHYAVLAFAYKRMGKILKFLYYGAIGFLNAPIACSGLFFRRKI